MPGPIATIGSMHVCPMVTGTTPHVGGPVSGPGAPNILVNGKPAALMGDICVCVGPPDTIAQGAPSVFFNGTPVACMGDMTAHGGTITVGEPNVIIGSAAGAGSVTMAASKIPFPEISITNRVLGNAKEALAAQQKLKEEAERKEGEPRIFNLQWVKEDRVIRESKVLKEVTLRAHVQNIDDGQSITFKVKRPIENVDEEGNKTTTEEDIIELTGTVKDKMVEVVWEVEDASTDQENS
ncbi:PAAR domain-containing protein [Spongiivirga citrea]|uniref:PAAR domain-containing protein n=1 Tax=Spongiivirga citrea TaxID=1481457 RepID=A0A6M0CKP5_9FLAO|nr:PAAR domain-containing protein [Spongiivirga citrea]NER18525.1 hypothetical protein [Spongiivirga citrea]